MTLSGMVLILIFFLGKKKITFKSFTGGVDFLSDVAIQIFVRGQNVL